MAIQFLSSFRWIATSGLFLLAMTASAHAAPGIALWGEVKYKPGFAHFDYVNPDATKGGALKLSANAPFDSLNPFLLKGVAAPGLQGFVYQTLMTQSADEPQSFYGLVAEDIAIAPDRSSVTFTLNPAARWSDGKPITSADVVFSFTALKEKAHPLYQILLKPVGAAQALNAHQVRFTLTDRTHRELPLILASLPVLPKHGFCADNPSPDDPMIRKNGSTDHRVIGSSNCQPFDKTTLTPPVGSGPYTVLAVEPGRSITYARDPHYWGARLPSQRGLYNFDTVRYDVYRDDVAALEGIKSHQFDFYEEFIARTWATGYDVPAVRSGALVKALIPHKIPRGMQGFIFNTRLPKFSDARVREAIGLTLDFEWMNQTLFYNAYTRNSSFFNNTDFEAKGLPDAAERALLEEFRVQSPESGKDSSLNSALRTLTTQPYAVPTTDGSGFPRDNLIRAQTLLNDAGWVMRNGVRVNAKTGEPLTVEFLMTQRTFERVIGIMRRNLDKLGIASTYRYVDASQYQSRVDDRQFEIVSVWWNQGLFYPGSEQQSYWASSQADIKGSQNLAGVKNPAVDFLIEKLLSAKTLGELIPAGRALDRVLLAEHYVIPHWNINAWRVLYWNQFGRPNITPAYSLCVDCWWAKPSSARPDQKDESAPAAARSDRTQEGSVQHGT